MSQQYDVKSQFMAASGTAVPYRTRLKGYVATPVSGATGYLTLYDTAYTSVTYTRTLTTVTVTVPDGHNLFTNQWVYLDFTSGGALDGLYQVTVTSTTQFTVTTVASGSISTSNVNLYSNVLTMVDVTPAQPITFLVPDQGILARAGIQIILPASTTATIFYG